ncbi:MAG: substrate-binding domain-containing protein [Desulfovibrio sp.]|nr:substrate-binding domain-containing protein [Desulfovibrio sp.]
MALKTNIYSEIVPLADALDKLLRALDAAHTASDQGLLPQPVACPTAEAEGRVLSAFVTAALAFPPFPLAAANGYALKAADTYAATSAAPTLLQEGKTCFAVTLGDALPPSCDAVALSVHAAVDGKGGVSITAPMLPWLHVRRTGADMAAGETLFCRNHILRPGDLGALLAAGVNEVQVWNKPQVFLATVGGSFLPPPEQTSNAAATAADRLIDGIIPALAARIQTLGGLAHRFAALDADAQAVRSFFQTSIAAGAQTLVLCVTDAAVLGVVRALLEAEGEIVAPSVGLLPGTPTLLAVYEGRPVFCLPTHPGGAFTAFEALVAPALLLLSRRPTQHFSGILPGSLDESGDLNVELAASLPAHPGLDVFSPLALTRVAEKTVALPLRMGEGYKTAVRVQGLAHVTASGKGTPLGSTARARPLCPVHSLYSTLFCAGGSDMVLDFMADELLRLPHAVHLVSASADAADALKALKNQHCHMAVLHMADDDKGEFNFGFVQQHLPGVKVVFVNLMIRQMGLVVPAGNPQGIAGIVDIKDKKLRCVNRQPGSSTRIQFDALVRHAKLTPQDISGYETEVESQLAVAAAVLTGKADCGPGVAAAASIVGLDFVPMGGERWDLVIPEVFLADPRVLDVLGLLQQDAFKKRLSELGGYKINLTGQKLELGVRLGA